MLTRREPARFGRAMGRLALGARTVEEAERRGVIASRLPSHEWPERPLQVTAVNARTGAFRVFERDERVPCSMLWPRASLVDWFEAHQRAR